MNDNFSEQLNVLKILDILLMRWNLILISAIIVGVFTFLYSEVFISPVYSSNASLYVNSNKQQVSDEITQTNINSSRQLVMTYAEILKARTFLSRIADELDDKYTVAQIKSMITMDSLNSTEILSINVNGTDADDVYKITKSIVKYAPDELIRVVEAGSVKVLDNASETKTPISPNIRKNTFIGVLIGIFIGAFIVIILELFDTRIKSGDEISKRYNEPVLGEIPSLTDYSYQHSKYGSTKTEEGGNSK